MSSSGECWSLSTVEFLRSSLVSAGSCLLVSACGRNLVSAVGCFLVSARGRFLLSGECCLLVSAGRRLLVLSGSDISMCPVTG